MKLTVNLPTPIHNYSKPKKSEEDNPTTVKGLRRKIRALQQRDRRKTEQINKMSKKIKELEEKAVKTSGVPFIQPPGKPGQVPIPVDYGITVRFTL